MNKDTQKVEVDLDGGCLAWLALVALIFIASYLGYIAKYLGMLVEKAQ